MYSKSSEPQPVGQILMQAPYQRVGLFARARHLADVNRCLPQWRSDAWVRQIRIANVRGQTAVIYSTSAAAAVPLRQHSRSLLHWLETNHRISCTRLDIKIRPQRASAPTG